LAGVRSFSIFCVYTFLWLADIPDEDLSIGVVHIAVGQLLAPPDKLLICGPHGPFTNRAQSLEINFFIPRQEVGEGFIGSNPCAGVPPFSNANLGQLQVIAKVRGIYRSSLSQPESLVCFLGTKIEIISVCGHSSLAGFQGNKLFRHVQVGRVNRDIPVQPIHLQSFLNIFNISREEA
jgi:hypothetical protein